MKVLLTGANGMLGQDLSPILEDIGAFVIETDTDNMDITDIELVKGVLSQVRPDFVIHCAAYTNVDKAEEEPEKAELINVKGTENVAKVCGELDIPLVYISTDYVFDGTKNSPYTPEDMPNPINVYGRTKLEGENMVKKYCEKYYIARTSWLYGHYGKNFVETMLSLKDKEEIKVVDDQRAGCNALVHIRLRRTGIRTSILSLSAGRDYTNCTSDRIKSGTTLIDQIVQDIALEHEDLGTIIKLQRGTKFCDSSSSHSFHQPLLILVFM